MNYMFNRCEFDQDISCWDIAAVTTFDGMFYQGYMTKTLCWDTSGGTTDSSFLESGGGSLHELSKIMSAPRGIASGGFFTGSVAFFIAPFKKPTNARMTTTHVRTTTTLYRANNYYDDVIRCDTLRD